MTVAAQQGEWGLAPIATKVGAGTFTPGSYTWRRMPVLTAQTGPAQMQDVLPPEIGGVIAPRGAYKRGTFFGGAVELLPRVENVLGFLLYAACGNVSSQTGKDLDGITATAVNSHIFRFDTADSAFQPWLAVRRMIPGSVAANKLGESGYDCKVANLSMVFPASGKPMFNVGIVGRNWIMEENPTWTWNNTFEDSGSIPESCTGYVTAGSDSPKILQASIDLVNGLTTPQQEMILGSYNPDDFVALSRAMSIRIMTKWEDPDLYQKVMTNSAAGTAWSSTPFRTTGSGPTWGFKLELRSPTQIPTSSPARNFAMQIRCQDVVWLPEGPPRMQAGGFLTQGYVGTVLVPASGDYCQIGLQNTATAYAWT